MSSFANKSGRGDVVLYWLTFAVLVLLSSSADAVKVYGGSGIGFSNEDDRWVSHIVFEASDRKAVRSKSDLFNGVEVTFQTGDVVTPSAPVDQLDLATITVPHTKSMAWCDPVANPDQPANTDFVQCYGQATSSKWFVIDLNALQQAKLSSVLVTVTAARLDDGVATETDANGNPLPSDDDLVPALTVFRGRQDAGAHGDWYPNTFQRNPFWAWKLKPFVSTSKNKRGHATAFGSSSGDSATVAGTYRLKPGNQNFLTVAVGGDARHEDLAAQHDVNFKLIVSVYSFNPYTDGIFANNFDLCGCEIGKTEWHLAMDHCMSIPECEKPNWKNGPPGVRCQTAAECKSNGGRWACGQKGVSCQK